MRLEAIVVGLVATNAIVAPDAREDVGHGYIANGEGIEPESCQFRSVATTSSMSVKNSS